MKKRILYCGDGDIDQAARYLSGVLKHLGLKHDYIPSDDQFNIRSHRFDRYDLVILSDYPSARISKTRAKDLLQHVDGGASLCMLGGWGSFKGLDGNYKQSPIQKALPVLCQTRDDRQQGNATYRIRLNSKNSKMMRLKSSDFLTAPSIAGYNKVIPKPGSRTLLNVDTFGFKPVQSKDSKSRNAKVLVTDPLLVLGSYGKGRVLALMTDLAPHWAGGLVDWGSRRHAISIKPRVSIEVGNTYIQFVKQLIDLLDF